MYQPKRTRAATRKNTRPKVNKTACLVALLATCLLVGLFWFFASTPLNTMAAAVSQEGPSTPQSNWQKGTVPALYQYDPQWAEHVYAETSFSKSGCGPICLTMAYISLTGDTSISPTAVADMASEGGYAHSEGTAWRFMIDGAHILGLEAEEFVLSKPLMNEYLSRGLPIICIMGKGDFTSTGHFIVIAGVNDEGNYLIRDPNSAERSSQSWSFEQLSKQYCNAWVFWQ